MRKYGKVDRNHNEIVTGLRQLGATVLSIASIGNGAPDILVGWRGRNYLFEIKDDRGQLTDDEETFFDRWNGQVKLVRNLLDAVQEIQL